MDNTIERAKLQYPAHFSEVDWPQGNLAHMVQVAVVLIEVGSAGDHDFIGVERLQRLLDPLEHLVVADGLRLPLPKLAGEHVLVAKLALRREHVLQLLVVVRGLPVFVGPLMDVQDTDFPPGCEAILDQPRATDGFVIPMGHYQQRLHPPLQFPCRCGTAP